MHCGGIAVLLIPHLGAALNITVWCSYVQWMLQRRRPSSITIPSWAKDDGRKVGHLLSAL